MPPARRQPHIHHARRGVTRRYVHHRSRGVARLTAFALVLGPGLVAGLSDDDPAGITTYSILGAEHGYTLLWTIPLATVLLIYFHLLGVRLGATTGRGFGTLLRDRYGGRVAMLCSALFVAANLGTICAEYAGIAAAGSLAHLPAAPVVGLAGVLVIGLVIRSSFSRVEHVLLALSALLASYVVAGFVTDVDWGATGKGLVVPHAAAGSGVSLVIAATVGTTLAPWGLAFIQSYAVDKGITWKQWRYERIDVIAGSLLTGVIGVSIAVVCAATLYPKRIVIHDASDAARALEPLAGSAATVLFGVGLMSAALLAAAVVPLATAYTVTEAAGRRGQLGDAPTQDRLFFGVFVALSVTAMCVASIPGLDLIRLIYISQVINCVVLPVQLGVLIHLARDRRLMGDHTISGPHGAVGLAGVGLVTASVAWMLYSLL